MGSRRLTRYQRVSGDAVEYEVFARKTRVEPLHQVGSVVAPDSDLGDGIASNGETHHRHHRDKTSSGADPTAPACHDSTTDPKSGDEESDDDDNGKVASLEVRPDSLLSLIFGNDSHRGDGHH